MDSVSTSPLPITSISSPISEPGDTKLDFYKALQAVLEGKRISRPSWNNKDFYGLLRSPDGQLAGTLQLHKPNGEFNSWILSIEDIIATDWILV